MNSTAHSNSEFPWKKTFVLLFELRYPGSLRGFGACFKNLLRVLYTCKQDVFVSVFIRILLFNCWFSAMSLPPKVVPKATTVAVSGPGSGPSPSSQLRATLTSVSLPPGAPTAPQPGAVPPPQYPLTWVIVLAICALLPPKYQALLFSFLIDDLFDLRGS